MSYIPNTDTDIAHMLQEMGVQSVDALFAHIPEELRLNRELKLPEPMSEPELLQHLEELAGQNTHVRNSVSFLGGGVYNHYIPSVVSHILGRSEFYTSYTPYQPEISQGTLQGIFEFQTLMCMLTGMDVSNASLYDGASAAAEAVLMSLRTRKRDRVVLSSAVNPEYRAVIKTYLLNSGHEIIEIPFDKRGATDARALSEAVDKSVSCVLLQSPNFFGVIEDLEKVEKIIHREGAHFIASFSEPLAFGILSPPGQHEADIVCGEGQSLGLAPGFGGPHLGILTCRKELLRTIPGRIAGRTVDMNGRTAYVLTLTAREQHIRREKATSNICTNQGLCAMTAAVYLAALGKRGFRTTALLNHERAEYAKDRIMKIRGVVLPFDAFTFNEFVIQIEGDLDGVMEELYGRNIMPGIRLAEYFPEHRNSLLIAVTEMNSKRDIDTFCDALSRAVSANT